MNEAQAVVRELWTASCVDRRDSGLSRWWGNGWRDDRRADWLSGGIIVRGMEGGTKPDGWKGGNGRRRGM